MTWWQPRCLSVFGCGCVIRWDKGLFVFVLLCVCCLACLRGVYIAAFQVTRRPVCNNWCFPNPHPLLRPPLTAANPSYRVTRFSPSLPEALRTSYQSHSVPHSPAQACTPANSYLLLSFPLCQSSEPSLVSGLIGDPHRTDARAIVHSKSSFHSFGLRLLLVLLIHGYHRNPPPPPLIHTLFLIAIISLWGPGCCFSS